MVDTAKPQAQFTPEKEALYQSLKNPDDPQQEPQFQFSVELQQELLGHLLHDKVFLVRNMPLLKANYFQQTAHQAIFSCLVKHYEEYSALPTTVMLMQALRQRVKDDTTKSLLYCGEAEAVIRAFLPGLHTQEYLSRRLVEFAKQAKSREGIVQFVKKIERGEAGLDVGDYWQQLAQAIKALDAPIAKPRLANITEFYAMEDDEYQFLIESRLPKGFLVLLAGAPKAGKTVIALNIIAQALLECFTLGCNAKPHTVCYLDFENPQKYLKQVLRNAASPHDVAELKPYLHIGSRHSPNPLLRLPPYLTVEYVQALIEEYHPDILWIDTVRRAFGRKPGLAEGWENKADVLDQLLSPFLDLAHASNTTIVFLHHHNHGGRASGSTEFLGIPDLLWDFTRVIGIDGKKSNDVILTIQGRLTDSTDPLYLTYEEGQYEYLGQGSDYVKVKEGERLENKKALAATIIKVLEVSPLANKEVLIDKTRKAHRTYVGVKTVEKAYKWLKNGNVVTYHTTERVHKLENNYRFKFEHLPT
jgi:hypothetical protein